MSPELIQIGIIIVVVLIVVKMLFSAGKRIISFIISIGFSIYFFMKFVWTYIDVLAG
ncbi:hypothetical protein [Cytobacillus sp. FSL K6-0265]|uniref:hypothetical protein n=1 Tax=Cytobacillus sp. FSL K6-0265 TaxID=2921448 RepID=UPI0030F61F8F